MNYKEMCEIIKAVSDSNLTFVEIKENDLYMKMSKGESLINDSNIVNKEVKNESVLETNIKEAENTRNNSKENENIDTDCFEIVTSPLVGMFYKSPSPDSEPYVKLGSKVNENDVLCIVEAMKLMNEIESCVKGEVVEIFVNDGEMVEYNQPLFKIKKD